MKRNPSRSRRNMVKTSKNKKVNKGPSATWWPNFENVKKQKMDFFIILTTPENMKTVCATLKSQCSIVIFAKIAKNWPNFSFLAIILVPNQKNPNFLDFLDPYTCPDLGQEESQKVWSTLVITLVATLVPTILKLSKSEFMFLQKENGFFQYIAKQGSRGYPDHSISQFLGHLGRQHNAV